MFFQFPINSAALTINELALLSSGNKDTYLDKKPKKNYLEECLSSTEGPIVSASDYLRLNSDQIRPFIKKSFYSFGTDGYGRSDTRKKLRNFFEVDNEHIVAYSLSVLAKEQLVPSKYAEQAIKKYNIDPDKPIPTKL